MAVLETLRWTLSRPEVHNSAVRSRTYAYDLIRVVALLRVMLWHATGAPWLTVFTAVPVMFYLNGKFATTGGPDLIGSMLRRLQRLLVPLAAYSAISIVFIVGIARWRGLAEVNIRDVAPWFIPFTNPQAPSWTGGWFTEPLWYLRTLLWLTLLTPALRTVMNRCGGRTSARYVLPGTLAVSALSIELFAGNSHWQLQDLVMYGAFFTAGMLGTFEHFRTSSLVRLAMTCAGLAAVLVVFRGVPERSVVNNSHSLHMLLGGAWLCVIILLVPYLERIATRPTVSTWVRTASARSLSLYLWHSPLFAVSWIAVRIAWSAAGFSSTGLSGVTLDFVVVVAGLYLVWKFSSLMSHVENISAGRVMFERTRPPALALCTIVVMLVASGMHQGPVLLPPPPSKGPTVLAVGGAYAAADGTTTDEHATTPDGAVGGGSRDIQPRTSGNAAHPESSTATRSAPVAEYAEPALRRVPSWEDLARPVSDDYAQELAGVVDGWLEKYRIPGISVAVLDTESGRWATTRGVGPDGSELRLDGQLRYTSLTKSFTAALILEQVAAGNISLTDPIGVLPQAPWFTAASTITVGELLSHRSGLVNYTETIEYKKDWQSINGWESALRAVQSAGPQFAHGSKQAYSSTNYIVAGLLAERLYRGQVEDLIAQRLLQPLGLGSTKVGAPSAGSPGSGTGNMTGTITDATRWAVAMWRDAEALSPQAQQLAVGFGAAEMLGYGTWRYCPCVSSGGVVKPSGIGADGGELTVRWYQRTNTVISVYVTEGVHLNDERAAQVEELISRLEAVL